LCKENQLNVVRCEKIGFVFQSYYLMPNLSAKQNIDLISEIAKDPIDTSEVLEMVAMQDRARNYPSQLSGGQQSAHLQG
jgi:putative ABC transport system ATP-binding protein